MNNDPLSCLFGIVCRRRSGKREPSTFIGETDEDEARRRYGFLPLNSSVVNLDNRQLGDAGVAYYVTASTTPCRVMYLSRNHLTRAGCQTLATALLAHPTATLTVLCLTTNAIGPQGARTLAHALRFNTSLTELLLGSNQIGPTGARAMAQVLEEVSSSHTTTTLRRLDLGNNRIGDAGAEAIAAALSKNRTLLKVSLWGNDIGPRGAQALARAMSAPTVVVQEVCLLNNRMGDYGAQSLARALETNTSLTSLILSNNNITDVSAVSLASALVRNATLRTLDLQGNSFTAAGRDTMVQARHYPLPNVVRYLMRESSSTRPQLHSLLQAMKHNCTIEELKLDLGTV